MFTRRVPSKTDGLSWDGQAAAICPVAYGSDGLNSLRGGAGFLVTEIGGLPVFSRKNRRFLMVNIRKSM